MELTDTAKAYLAGRLEIVEQLVTADAEEIARLDGASLIALKHVEPATARYASGSPHIPQRTLQDSLANVPGIIWVAAVLAAVFGGLQGMYPDNPSLGDMAKLLAGTIVGGIGAQAAKK